METILIVCGAGASSTFLASRIRAAAKAQGLPAAVAAAGQDELESRLAGTDVLLVGSHLADHFADLAARAHAVGVAAALLPPTALAPGGPEAALALARGLARPGQSDHHPLTEGLSHG
jgi:PTS system cellobiose-specific IIB component